MKNILLFVTVTALFTTILGANSGNHYAFAQEGAITPEGSVNDTMSGQNASQWATNATLAFAQEGFQTEDLVNETIDIGNATTSNATLAFAQEGAITPEGSVNDTLSGQNASQWATNATLAFAQEGAITPEGSVNDTLSGQNASQWATNATLAFVQ